MVRSFLDLSSAHLPHELFCGICDGSVPVTNLLSGPHGIMFHVPADREERPETPPVLSNLYAVARRLRADYLHFDGDAPIAADLPDFLETWDA